MSTPLEMLTDLMEVEGAMCAALVDCDSGLLLEAAGSGVDLETAAAGNAEVVRAKMKLMRALGLDDGIEDILISLGRQYHIIRPSKQLPGLFIYYVLDRAIASLAMARHAVLEAEARVKL